MSSHQDAKPVISANSGIDLAALMQTSSIHEDLVSIRLEGKQKSGARFFTRADIAALVTILLVGAIHLPIPFHDDQVLFTMAGWKMDHGALLYRDFWDI